MKKYLLALLAIVLLSFMLASCMPQDHAPIVSFTSPNGANVKTIADGGVYGPGVYTFSWSVADVDKKDVVTTEFILTHKGTNVSAVVNGTTATATLTDAGTYTAKVVATDKKGLSSSVEENFAIQTNSNIQFNGKALYGLEYINLSWSAADGKAHNYQWKLDDGNWSETTASTSVRFVPEAANGSVADGSHLLFVRIADNNVNLSSVPVAVYPFRVDTTPPTIVFQNSDRDSKNYSNVYVSRGDSNPEGRYDLVIFRALDASKMSSIRIRFYQFVSVKATDGSVMSERFRLGLKDSNGDGIYDSWSYFDSDGKLYTAATQPWFDWDPYFVNNYGYDYILFNDGDVDLWSTNGKKIAHNLFNLNTQYAMWVDMVDEAGNESGGYTTFELKERYDSEGKPVVYVDTSNATVTAGSNITFNVKAPNVKSYCESGNKGVNYDVTNQSTLSYFHIPVIIKSTSSLSSSDVSVVTHNFISGKKDFTGYTVTQLYPDTVLVDLYKGFANGTDESEAATDTLMNITINVPSDVASNTQYSAFLSYDGWFTDYPNYKGHLPNPVFKNFDNQVIDGIDTYDTGTAIVIANPSESK